MSQRFTSDIGGIAVDMVKALKLVSKDRFSGKQREFWGTLLERVDMRLRREYEITPTPQEAHDAALAQRVKEILQGEPFKSLDEKMEADAELFRKAMKDLDFQHHEHWEIMGFKEIGIREPPRGDPSCKGAFDLWVEKRRMEPIPPALVAIETERNLLDSTHARYLAELKKRPVIPVIVTGQGVEEEAPPE